MARRPQWLPRGVDAPGVLLAAGVAAVAFVVARVLPQTPYLSDILLGLILGAVVLNSPLRQLFKLELPGRDREPDRYANGLRWIGKWVLRLSIILMGFSVRTGDFRAADLATIFGCIALALPGAFLITHAVAVWAGVRSPMADLLAAGTMICGQSAVNAVAPAVGAHREEQGVAIAAVFLFSVIALVCYRPIGDAIGLDAHHAGLWAGLSVNDLSSAIAVGGEWPGGAVFAAAAKSSRVLMLAPILLMFAVGRSNKAAQKASGLGASLWAAVPRYLFGYVALAGLRALGDHLGAADHALWGQLVAGNEWAVKVLLLVVAVAVGLHLEARSLVGSGLRAILVGGAASVWMAGSTLAMVTLVARGRMGTAAIVGLAALTVAFVVWRGARVKRRRARLLEQRFAAGLPVSLAEAGQILEQREGTIDEVLARQLLRQVHPTIGELIPARESPLTHGDGSRWLTYWQGKSGWALVAVLREPGSATPIHAHPHRVIGKTIEGTIEELRFAEEGSELVLTSRNVMAHDELVEVDGLQTVHLVRNLASRDAIDLQLRGPEAGVPGRHLDATIDVLAVPVGTRFAVRASVDERPGHCGDGASTGRWQRPAD